VGAVYDGSGAPAGPRFPAITAREEPMGFVDAIKTCFSKYASFSGRATRSEYWWWVLFVVLGGVVTGIVNDGLNAVFGLAILVPSIAAAARRLHDIGKSGWWQLVGFIPLLGLILMIYWTVQPSQGDNEYGSAGPLTAGI
jgi:uncharacterized membrane protein YhaH (DUF805 family)